MAGQAATTRCVELFGVLERVPVADRSGGRAWRHVIGSGRLGAESSRTRRAAREGVRVWARLWRGVERGRRDREFAWNTLLACLVDRA